MSTKSLTDLMAEKESAAYARGRRDGAAEMQEMCAKEAENIKWAITMDGNPKAVAWHDALYAAAAAIRALKLPEERS